MTKTISVKSSSASSSDDRKEKGILSLFSWTSLYKLCPEIPHFNFVVLLRIFEILGYISLSLDPDFSWGSSTKTLLIYIRSIFRGLYVKSFNSIAPFIILQVVALLLILITILGMRHVLRADNPKPQVVLSVQLLFYVVTQVISLMLRSIIMGPWKCDFTTGMLVDFPEYYCFETPNLIFFILSFVSFFLLTLICVVKNLL